jgi:hypothetical protein
MSRRWSAFPPMRPLQSPRPDQYHRRWSRGDCPRHSISVPLMFAYHPFLSSNPLVQLYIAALSLPGIYALSAAIEGFAEAPLPEPTAVIPMCH